MEVLNMAKELVVVFHCDPCGIDVKIVGVLPEQDDSVSCPFCRATGGKFYPYDDYYLIPEKRGRL
jgi:hypothetical protein